MPDELIERDVKDFIVDQRDILDGRPAASAAPDFQGRVRRRAGVRGSRHDDGR